MSQENSMDGKRRNTRLQTGSGLKSTQTRTFRLARSICRLIGVTHSLGITASLHGTHSCFKPLRWQDYVDPSWIRTTLNNQGEEANLYRAVETDHAVVGS